MARPRGSREARGGTCPRCGGDWYRGDRNEPAYDACVCVAGEGDDGPGREPGEDDGREYGHPGDKLAGWED